MQSIVASADNPERWRAAAIDLGTNTVRLLVADFSPVKGLLFVHQAQEVTRLGEGLGSTGALAPQPMARTAEVVSRYTRVAKEMGAETVLVVGTSAMRDASNTNEFSDLVSELAGVAPLIVSGDEEARLALLGTRWGLALGNEPFLLVDIGGGSTEFIAARGERMLGVVSTRLGVVDLTERWLSRDPIHWPEFDRLTAHVRRTLQVEALPLSGAEQLVRMVGTAGTVTTLAALDLGLTAYSPERVNGHLLRVVRIKELLAWLGAMSSAERAALPCMEPGRADILIAGVGICLAAMESFGFGELTVSEYGLREGALLRLFAAWPGPSH